MELYCNSQNDQSRFLKVNLTLHYIFIYINNGRLAADFTVHKASTRYLSNILGVDTIVYLYAVVIFSKISGSTSSWAVTSSTCQKNDRFP